jgi:hypothetical protein
MAAGFYSLGRKRGSLGGSGIDRGVGVVHCNTVYMMRKGGKRAEQEGGGE